MLPIGVASQKKSQSGYIAGPRGEHSMSLNICGKEQLSEEMTSHWTRMNHIFRTIQRPLTRWYKPTRSCHLSVTIVMFLVTFGSLSCAMDRDTANPKASIPISSLGGNLYSVATTTGNVVVSVGPDGAFLVGTPDAPSTSLISEFVAQHTTSPARYVVVMPEAVAASEGDAGWQARGAYVAMQENALGRLGGHTMGALEPLPARLQKLGVSRPRISFSEVLSFDINGDSIHVVHQSPGYSDADAVVHFHVANLVYIGEVFPGDGYPIIDFEQNGSIDGIIKSLTPWTDGAVRVVPARGNVVNGETVKSFLSMLRTVKSRVERAIGEGKTETQILDEHPTADFDAIWGDGRVSPAQFVHEVYRSVTTHR